MTVRKYGFIEEKESFRWFEALKRSMADLPPGHESDNGLRPGGGHVRIVCQGQSLGVLLLIRIVRNRMTAENGRILDEIQKERCRGRVEATIPRDSRICIPEWQAVLQPRYASYPVKRLRILNPVKTLPDVINMSVIYVKEEKPPARKEPVEWFGSGRKMLFTE
jgi:hypothetical protein